nr:MAG TPA: hypothetical protein [Caudoviricetes sp.]
MTLFFSCDMLFFELVQTNHLRGFQQQKEERTWS